MSASGDLDESDGSRSPSLGTMSVPGEKRLPSELPSYRLNVCSPSVEMRQHSVPVSGSLPSNLPNETRFSSPSSQIKVERGHESSSTHPDPLNTSEEFKKTNLSPPSPHIEAGRAHQASSPTSIPPNASGKHNETHMSPSILPEHLILPERFQDKTSASSASPSGLNGIDGITQDSLHLANSSSSLDETIHSATLPDPDHPMQSIETPDVEMDDASLDDATFDEHSIKDDPQSAHTPTPSTSPYPGVKDEPEDSDEEMIDHDEDNFTLLPRTQRIIEIPDSQEGTPESLLSGAIEASEKASPIYRSNITISSSVPSIANNLRSGVGGLSQSAKAAPVDDDDGDDLMIIDPKSASAEAQAKWGKTRIILTEKSSPIVKPDPDSDRRNDPNNVPSTPQIPSMESLLAVQKRMMEGKHNPPKKKIRQEDSEIPSPVVPEYMREGRVDTAVVDAALKPTGEDNSWMEDEGDDVDDIYETWTRERDELQKREKNGKITLYERMKLSKLRNQIIVRDRVRNRGIQEDGDSLFVPDNRLDNRSEASRRGRANSEEEEPQADHENFRRIFEGFAEEKRQEFGMTKSGKPRKRRAPAKTAREKMEREEEKRIEKERAKAQKKKARGEKPSKKKGSKGEKGGKGKDVVKNGPSLLQADGFNRNDGNDDVAKLIIDFMQNDPIQERLQNPIFNVSAEPTISGTMSKESQLEKLWSNLPEGATAAAKSDRKRLRDASKSFGFGKCTAKDGKWLIKGMNSTPYHHQLLGAQWMVQRELSTQSPNGGLLADSMGLGKTVQTLACMVGNLPTDKDIARKTRATLIVGPAGVVDQWIDEIKTHADKKIFQKVIRYRSSQNLPVEVLEDMDIVVTSYNEVQKQFSFPSKLDKPFLNNATGDLAGWMKDALDGLGPLHQVNWYRVVLDEAQHIKNNQSRTSLACQNLKSVFRWCLTGTPLLNKLEELFPYLRFLKANYSMDWKTFQKYFCDPDADDSYQRISTLLSYTMMRRTMKTTILDRPIINLPKPHPEILYVSFSQEEQIIYRITENRFRANLNEFFAKGEARRNYGTFMVQLLRLRQCTSHPFMLEQTIRESWTLEDIQELRARLARLGRNSKPFYEQCKLWVEQSEAEKSASLARGEIIMPFGTSKYGHSFNLDKALASLSEKELFERVVCAICSDLPMQPVKTDCGHIFCHDCLTEFLRDQAVQYEIDFKVCPSCDKIFDGTENVPVPEDTLDRDDVPSGKVGKKKHSYHPNSKGRDALGFEPMTQDGNWVTKSDFDDDFELAPSAKTACLKAILLKGFVEAPLDKVVIYVQFRTLARIVGRICRAENWGFVYLTGDASLDHRTKAIKKFKEDGEIKILIAGLKCGGLGLNFPWANRCISLDLWWNHAVEQQAFGRIFRIGQVKETHMTRIVVKNTVDMRMLSMQLRKLQSLEKAITEGDAKPRPDLSLSQLANLFGFLKTDADDNIVSIEPDYVDDEDQYAAQVPRQYQNPAGEGSGYNAGLAGWHDELDPNVEMGDEELY